MAEYSREQRNQLSRVIANSESGSRQLKGFADNRVLQLKSDTRDFEYGKLSYNINIASPTSGSKKVNLKKGDDKSNFLIGVDTILNFEPSPQEGVLLDTKKIGFIQIIKKTGDRASNMYGRKGERFLTDPSAQYLPEEAKNALWARFIRTANNGFRIDSMSNTPYYGSDRIYSGDETPSSSLPLEKVKIKEDKKVKNQFGYYYISDGCALCRLKKQNAIMYDSPKSFGDESGSKSEFETRVFDIENRKYFGGVKWGYEVGVDGNAKLLSTEFINGDNENYNEAVDKWNRLKMAIYPAFPEIDGQVISEEKKLSSGNIVENDHCTSIYQIGRLDR